MTGIKTKPIFIHSLFRTGSTYLWNKFRLDRRFHCYYEPFHQIFPLIDHNNVKRALTPDFKKVKHPDLDKPYLEEYETLLEEGKQGIPHFKESFCFSEFCNNNENPDLQRYIDYLIDGAGSKTPVLQFNRSSLRTRWFKENYPGSRNIYLLRNPRDQWQSYVELQNRLGDDVFFVMDLLCVCKNISHQCFTGLAAHLPLLEYHGVDLSGELSFYQRLLADYSMEERYFIFYHIWFRAFLENVLNADITININRLSSDADYRETVCSHLEKSGVLGLDFGDARIHRYSTYRLTETQMADIEHQVRCSVLASLLEPVRRSASQHISAADMHYFQWDADLFLKDAKPSGLADDISRKTIEKFKRIIVRQVETNDRLDRENKNKAAELEQLHLRLAEAGTQIKRLVEQSEARQAHIHLLSHQIDSIKNSRSWRYMAPFRYIHRILFNKK